MERPVRINPDTTTNKKIDKRDKRGKDGKPQLFSDSASVSVS